MRDDGYKDYILEQLDGLEISARKMFGSFGLYLEGNFFAIISDNIVYFKTNKTTVKKYKEFGMSFLNQVISRN